MTTKPGAPEQLRTLSDAIRDSLDANNAWEQDSEAGVLTVFDGNKDVLADCLADDIAALAAPSESSDLIAAVEALPGHDAWNTGITRGDYVDRAAVLALIESRPASREAGLDADRLHFRSYDGQTEAQTGQGDHCVFVMLRGANGAQGIVMTDDEAEAMGRALIRRAEYARRLA